MNSLVKHNLFSFFSLESSQLYEELCAEEELVLPLAG